MGDWEVAAAWEAWRAASRESIPVDVTTFSESVNEQSCTIECAEMLISLVQYTCKARVHLHAIARETARVEGGWWVAGSCGVLVLADAMEKS